MENFTARAANILGKALYVHTQATIRYPDDPDFDVLISILFFKAKDLKNAVGFFNASLSKNNGKITEGMIDSATYHRLRTVCEQLGKMIG